ncbi:MAG: monofunctional biosynthetic peptidoglycan transglycosylase [Acidobacteria bacterium]|nr:MAG: monofunctional biosynthetic peptidoglycan transglycosylase [Acidobacteriota bacterium]
METEEIPNGGWWQSLRRWWVLILVVITALVLWAAYQWLTLPAVAELADRDPTTTAFIERYRELRRQVGEKDTIAQTWLEYDRISPHLKRAVLVAEDIDFFSHQGFATEEVEQAVRDAVREREFPRGASTITQQLAKNLWLSPERSFWRKIEEALLTRQLERHLDKRRIFEIYLNVVEFGPGIYGAEAASRAYFDKSAADLTERQAAELAAILPRPSRWHPRASSRAYRQRVATIERRMEKAEWLWKVI